MDAAQDGFSPGPAPLHLSARRFRRGRWEDLPEAARRYVEYVERAIGCPIGYVSVGPERESLILR